MAHYHATYLMSDYLSSNIIICILFFDSTHFNNLGLKIEPYFWLIFGSNENFKICFRDYLTFRRETNIKISHVANQLNCCCSSRSSRGHGGRKGCRSLCPQGRWRPSTASEGSAYRLMFLCPSR